jgi:hypothetical protein
MQVRRVATVAAVAVLAAGAYAPAMAKAKPKPITKAYDMQLMPVPDPADTSLGNSCTRAELEGISIHTESFKVPGPGTLSVKVSGFTGDWDITVSGPDGVEGVGDGTTTPNTSAGEDTYVQKFKKATQLTIATCNFAGTPAAHGEYKFTYK